MDTDTIITPRTLYQDTLNATAENPALPVVARDRVAYLWTQVTPRTRASVLVTLAWRGRRAQDPPPTAMTALSPLAVETAYRWHTEAARTLLWDDWYGYPADRDRDRRYQYEAPDTVTPRQAAALATDPDRAAMTVDTALALACLVHHADPGPRPPQFLYMSPFVPHDTDPGNDWE